jgi:hypothetical protein
VPSTTLTLRNTTGLSSAATDATTAVSNNIAVAQVYYGPFTFREHNSCAGKLKGFAATTGFQPARKATRRVPTVPSARGKSTIIVRMISGVEPRADSFRFCVMSLRPAGP